MLLYFEASTNGKPATSFLGTAFGAFGALGFLALSF
jgi:hypothetical protein